jgi:hypothetical protein
MAMKPTKNGFDTSKELEKIRNKLYSIQLQLKKEGGVRNEMAQHRLSLADETIARTQRILTRTF